MQQLAESVNKFLTFNEYKILQGKGRISKLQADKKAIKDYDDFNKTQKIISDFDKEIKFEKQINVVVCWQADKKYKERFYLESLLIGDEGLSREIFGSTHQAFAVGSQSQPSFEVIVLEDLLNWIQDPQDEEARQKRLYKD